jgi:hypothetical protein
MKELQEFVLAARNGVGQPALSDRTRANIAEALATRTRAPRRWAAPFVPFQRLAWAAALPVVAGLLLLSFGIRGPQGVASDSAIVAASKDGDLVRFTLEGGRGVRVYRSTSAVGDAQRVTVRGGSFRDRLDDQASIVFYRVE